jgi:hypothetical protein
MLFVNQTRMPPPTLNLKRLQAIARSYNGKLKKPIKVAQKKADLRNELLARNVSLYSKTEQLKNMVRRANNKATNYDRVKRRAEKSKKAGTGRHLDNVIDRLEKKHGKKQKKSGAGAGASAGAGAVAPKDNILIPRKKPK